MSATEKGRRSLELTKHAIAVPIGRGRRQARPLPMGRTATPLTRTMHAEPVLHPRVSAEAGVLELRAIVEAQRQRLEALEREVEVLRGDPAEDSGSKPR